MSNEKIELDEFIKLAIKNWGEDTPTLDERFDSRWRLRFVMDLCEIDFDEEFGEDFPYEFVDDKEVIGHKNSYINFTVIKRKSDGKYFQIHTRSGSYGTDMSDDSFTETKKVVVEPRWEFQDWNMD